MHEHMNFIGKATDPEELESLIANLQEQVSILRALTSTLQLFSTDQFTGNLKQRRIKKTLRFIYSQPSDDPEINCRKTALAGLDTVHLITSTVGSYVERQVERLSNPESNYEFIEQQMDNTSRRPKDKSSRRKKAASSRHTKVGDPPRDRPPNPRQAFSPLLPGHDVEHTAQSLLGSPLPPNPDPLTIAPFHAGEMGIQDDSSLCSPTCPCTAVLDKLNTDAPVYMLYVLLSEQATGESKWPTRRRTLRRGASLPDPGLRCHRQQSPLARSAEDLLTQRQCRGWGYAPGELGEPSKCGDNLQTSD